VCPTTQDLDVVIDVGGVYDPATHRYDHHQREFKEMFGHGFSNTKLSSAGGLVGDDTCDLPCLQHAHMPGCASSRRRPTWPHQFVRTHMLAVPSSDACLPSLPCQLPLTTPGLVYRHFGREVVAKLAGLSVDDPSMDPIYLQIYKVGARGAGVRACEGGEGCSNLPLEADCELMLA